MRLSALFGLLVAPCLFALGCSATPSTDVVVYGGTSGGVIAAVAAGRTGKTVVLIEPSKHLGGMTTGGLGATDMGNEKAIGGISREFYQRILKYYEDPSVWKYETAKDYAKREKYYHEDALFGFEPHVGEKIYNDMLGEEHVKVVLGERLDLKDGVKKDGTKITSIKMESGQVYAGKVFIDGSYEGDLLAKAGVSYAVGREANSQYGEGLDGVEAAESKGHQFGKPVDPYWSPGKEPGRAGPDRLDTSRLGSSVSVSARSLVPYIHAGSPGVDGSGDERVQAYNYRICMTNVEENRVPFPKPTDYDEKDYELLLRYYEAGSTSIPWGPRGMPNQKTDSNNSGAFSTDFIGMADAYPDAGYAERDKMIAAHIRYVQGLLWTVANHPRVPEKVREAAGKWGLAKDEFTDNNNWPYQLYVREARRMVGEYVMTDHETTWERKVEDPIGLGSYNMDSHHCQRYVDETGHARNEGDIEVGVAGPYGISYRSIVPKGAECTNLLVPVCMSASHIAYGSIRMEPVYMILGQACGAAAGLAIDENVDVQKVSYARLREKLLADKQLLEWTGPAAHRGKISAKLPGIVLDDKKAILTGEWLAGNGGGIDHGYQHDGNTGKGQKSARFELKVPKDGRYEVRFAYTTNPNRATNVPVTIESADGSTKHLVNEREEPAIDHSFVSLGIFRFTAEQGAVVVVSNENTNGFVIIDAVQLLPVP